MVYTEREICGIQNSLMNQNQNASCLQERLNAKKQELRERLQESVKSALVRSCFVSVQDMDAPTTFFL